MHGRMIHALIYTFLIALGFILGGCKAGSKDRLIIGGASSLTRSLQKQLENIGDPHIQLHTASSGALAQQIINGAQLDIFISASDRWTKELIERGLIEEAYTQSTLGNQLVVVVPIASPLQSLEDLIAENDQALAVGNFESVPVGEYTEQWLASIQLLDSVKPRLVFLKNEQQVLRAVENNHASAGIIYQSSLKQSENIRAIHVPKSTTYSEIRYYFSITNNSTHKQKALELIDKLKSETARKIWLEEGFTLSE